MTTARPAKTRSEGQWALGEREPFNIGNRENVQFHWIRIQDVPEIWRRLEAVGLQTTEACGDCPRGIHGSPLAGESPDEVLDASPAIDEILRRFLAATVLDRFDQAVANRMAA